MSELFEKSIRALELPRVLELLKEQAVSPEAKERALRIRPETETEEVLRLLDQTDAARSMIGQCQTPQMIPPAIRPFKTPQRLFSAGYITPRQPTSSPIAKSIFIQGA